MGGSSALAPRGPPGKLTAGQFKGVTKWLREAKLKRLDARADYAAFQRWQQKLEAGLSSNGVRAADLAPEDLANLSHFVLEDALQEVLEHDRAFVGKGWEQLLRHICTEELKLSPAMLRDELLALRQLPSERAKDFMRRFRMYLTPSGVTDREAKEGLVKALNSTSRHHLEGQLVTRH